MTEEDLFSVPFCLCRRTKVFTKKIKNFLRESEAATTVEYAVMLMLIIGGCIVAIQALGGESGALWGGNVNSVGDAMNN